MFFKYNDCLFSRVQDDEICQKWSVLQVRMEEHI